MSNSEVKESTVKQPEHLQTDKADTMDEPKTFRDAEQIMIKQLQLLQKACGCASSRDIAAMSHAMAAIYTAVK